ncbi:MAG TPA: hypothetical protein VF506_00920, partial [Streptosporangiaceae bacterium]
MTLVRRDTPPPDNPDDEEILHRLGGVMPGKRLPAKRAPAEPAIPEPAELEPVDGEVVDEQPIRVQSRRLPASVQKFASGKTAERAAITAIGMARLSGKAYDGASYGTYKRQIKANEGVGNSEEVKAWVVLLEEAKQRRHDRLRHVPGMAFGFFGMAVLAVFAACFLAFLWAVFAPLMWGWSFTGTFTGGLRLVGYGVVTCTVLLFGILGLAPFVVAAVAYREGRRVTHPPSWVQTSADADTDIEITEYTISQALEALGISEIRAYLKQDLPLQFIVGARTDGRGTRAVIRLPTGVTAEMVTKRRTRLAGGLYRAAKEVWPTTGAEAGILDLWVADKGALEEGAGPYPLLADGAVDVFHGVPFGRTLRGDPVSAP